MIAVFWFLLVMKTELKLKNIFKTETAYRN